MGCIKRRSAGIPSQRGLSIPHKTTQNPKESKELEERNGENSSIPGVKFSAPHANMIQRINHWPVDLCCCRAAWTLIIDRSHHFDSQIFERLKSDFSTLFDLCFRCFFFCIFTSFPELATCFETPFFTVLDHTTALSPQRGELNFTVTR